MAKKIIACKVLMKFHKEEFPIKVIAVATQFSEGTTLSWAPNFFNLFLEDWKDAQDLGT
jgi:hypothetical protein